MSDKPRCFWVPDGDEEYTRYHDEEWGRPVRDEQGIYERLCLGSFDAEGCTVACPRHGASFDLASGRALSLPAYLPVRTFPVRVEDGVVVVEVDG